MNIIAIIAALAAPALAYPGGTTSNSACPPANFDALSNAEFELSSYVGQWYVQQQAVTNYLPLDQNYCVAAFYTSKSDGNVDVYNFSRKTNVTGDVMSTEPHLVAYTNQAQLAKLAVVPSFIPSFIGKALAGPYWIIAVGPKTTDGLYSWALISGGQPTVASNGACIANSSNFDLRTILNGDGQGQWIFTREKVADPAVIEEVRTIAKSKGLDVTALNKVEQVGCEYVPSPYKA